MNVLPNFNKSLEASPTLRKYKWEINGHGDPYFLYNNTVYHINVFTHDGLSVHAKNMETGTMESKDCREVEKEVTKIIMAEAREHYFKHNKL